MAAHGQRCLVNVNIMGINWDPNITDPKEAGFSHKKGAMYSFWRGFYIVWDPAFCSGLKTSMKVHESFFGRAIRTR